MNALRSVGVMSLLWALSLWLRWARRRERLTRLAWRLLPDWCALLLHFGLRRVVGFKSLGYGNLVSFLHDLLQFCSFLRNFALCQNVE